LAGVECIRMSVGTRDGRRPRASRIFAAVIGLAVALVLPSTAFAIDEYPITDPPQPRQPSGITLGPDGALWFVEENGPSGRQSIGRLDPAQAVPGTSTGITEYPIPTLGAIPSKIVTGPVEPDGRRRLWFTEQSTNKIGALDPVLAVPGMSTGITEFPVSPPSAPDGITVGPDGALWFTQFSGNRIGRITTDGTITHYPLPSGNGSPSDIVLGPDNRLWFTEEFPGRIGVLDPARAVPGTSQGFSEFDRPNTEPAGIAASGASLWFTKHLTNAVEQMSLSGAKLGEFPTGAFPSGITFGPDGALWLTELEGNRIGRLTTCGGYTAFTIPTPASDPSDIVTGPDGALWFTEFSNTANKIGRIQAGSSSDCAGGGGGGVGGSVRLPISQSGIPRVQSLSVSPRAFRAAKAGASISAKVGTKVTYRLSISASARFTVEKESVGRKKGKKCVKPTRGNRRAKKCKLYKAVRGSFTHNGKAGSNSFKFSGRVGRKSLRPGRYRLVAIATVGSSKSAVKQASFKIVRR
jgi:virginiamycin B lyase